MSAISLTHAQQQFTATLSAVEDAVHYAFRGRLRPQEYEETLAEAKAAAWSAWHGLIRKGKDPLAVGVTGIANNAIRYVLRNGRRVGNPTSGRGAPGRLPQGPEGPATSRSSASFPPTTRSSPARWSGRGRTGWSRTAGSAPPTRRLSGSTSRCGWPACLRRSAGSLSCWPRGTRGSSWPASSGSRSRGSANCEGSWPRAGMRSRTERRR